MIRMLLMNVSGDLNSRGTKDILAMMVQKDEDPQVIADREGLIQKSDPGAIRAWAQAAIDANPEVVLEYRSGKEALLMFFVGKVMKESKGSANPALTQEILKELLSA
jgi:aspartyl-tRNA(Asn)/glutamyl-tRNA(Gln) amidotransferase subunit B